MTDKRTKTADAGVEAGDRQSLALRFDRFGWQALESAAERQHESLEDLISAACGYFVLELETERVATRLPRFRDTRGEPRELELSLPSRIWQSLEQQAESQDAEPSRIVEHATLLYLADLDSGRATHRLLDD